MNEMLRLARSLIREVVVAPIQRGRPRPAQWPRGLGAAVTVTFVIGGFLLLVTVLSPILRKVLPLVGHPGAGIMPLGSLQVLFGAAVLVTILVQVAGLHANWAVRSATLFLTVIALSTFMAVGEQSWVTPAMMAAIVLLVLVYPRGEFRWWSIPLVAAPMMIGMVTPLWRVRPYLETSLDQTGLAFLSTLLAVSIAATPALVSAGFAPSEVALRAGDWMADRFTESVRRSVPWIAGGLSLGLVVELILALQSGLPEFPGMTEMLGTLAHVALAAVIALPVWAVSRRHRLTEPADLQHLRERWEPAALLLGLALAVSYALTAFGASFYAWSVALERPGLQDFGDRLLTFVSGPYVTTGLIFAVGAVLLALGIVRARKGRPLVGIAAAAMLADSLLRLVGDLMQSTSGIAFSSDALGILAAATGGGILLWDAITPEKTPVNVSALLLIALPVAYHFRFLLAEPFTALVGTGGAAIVVVGLLWDMLSGWDVTEKQVPGVPGPSRVLLMAASLLAATIATAYAGLSRSSGSALNTSALPVIGDTVVGSALFLGAVLLLAYAALHPKGSPRRIAAGTHHGSGH